MKKEQAEIFSANMSKVGGVLKIKTHEFPLDEVYESSCGNLKMIAAKTGKGKSTLMLERALESAKNGENVLFITQEPVQNVTRKIKDSTISDSVEKLIFKRIHLKLLHFTLNNVIINLTNKIMGELTMTIQNTIIQNLSNPTPESVMKAIRYIEVDLGESFLERNDIFDDAFTLMNFALEKGYISQEKFDLWEEAFEDNELGTEENFEVIMTDDTENLFALRQFDKESDLSHDEQYEQALLIYGELVCSNEDYINEFVNTVKLVLKFKG